MGVFLTLWLTHHVLVADLPNSVGLASSTALVALDIVTRERNAIARNDFSGFKKRNVANDQILKPKHEQVEREMVMSVSP